MIPGKCILWLILLHLVIGYDSAKAQLSSPGKPYPVGYPGAREIPFITLTNQKNAEHQSHGDSLMLKNATSGELIQVNYHPGNSGVWDTVADGIAIWRAGFRIPDASVINLIFSPWRLETGVKLFIYDPHQKHTRGAFTSINNKTTGILATAGIPGDQVIVEMQVPIYREYGSIGIQGIGFDFRKTADALKKDEWFGESGPCNPDIGCSENTVANTLKRSVVRIVYKGHERCTGTLINSAQKYKINYILTAGHCFTRESDANTAVFYFEYESPFCQGPDGDDTKSLSGATIRSRSSDVDFALLELLEPIPESYNAYYAGWDNRGRSPQSGFVIHHPQGDVKKIAEEDDPITVSSFGSLYDPQTHWMVNQWETGTTEPGSSGAPLFDRNGLIQGTLTGGLATCEDPVSDYFQMFSHSWNDYPEPENQLAVWLDPLNIRPTVLMGYDPDGASNEPPFEGTVIAYPNPASDQINIIFREISSAPVHLTLFSLQGQVVYDQAYDAFQHIIPVSLQGFSGGIYIVRIRTGNQEHHIKIAVLK